MLPVTVSPRRPEPLNPRNQRHASSGWGAAPVAVCENRVDRPDTICGTCRASEELVITVSDALEKFPNDRYPVVFNSGHDDRPPGINRGAYAVAYIKLDVLTASIPGDR